MGTDPVQAQYRRSRAGVRADRRFRAICGRDAPVLVDQEGGRVQRLGPPHWPAYPAGAVYGALYGAIQPLGLRAAHLGARLIAADLAALGITVDCLPLADVPVAGADRVIGDRAYGDTPDQVAAIAAAVADGLMGGGVLPVLKHFPGHGRATADSHERLPVVDADRATLEATDFAAFRPLAGLPLGMTAHVVFTAIDPGLPATTSTIMIDQVIRSFIGFTGALMSDDVSMGALSGSIADRTRRSLAPAATSCSTATGISTKWRRSPRNVRSLPGSRWRVARGHWPRATRPTISTSPRRAPSSPSGSARHRWRDDGRHDSMIRSRTT